MKNFLAIKEKQASVCGFFAMIIAMCFVGSYYLQYSQDLYWVKLFTDICLIICGVYVFASSCVRNDKIETSAAACIIIILFFAFLENVFWLIKRAEWRMTAEAISLAFKSFGVTIMLDEITIKKSLVKKWWYILSSVILLLLPAVLKSLPLLVDTLSTSVSEEKIALITIAFNGAVLLYGLFALVVAIIAIVKKNNALVAWSSACYSLSVVLFGLFGILRQAGINAAQWSKNTAVVFELGIILLLVSIANYGKHSNKSIKTRK